MGKVLTLPQLADRINAEHAASEPASTATAAPVTETTSTAYEASADADLPIQKGDGKRGKIERTPVPTFGRTPDQPPVTEPGDGDDAGLGEGVVEAPKADLSLLPVSEHGRAAALIASDGIPSIHAKAMIANLAEMSAEERLSIGASMVAIGDCLDCGERDALLFRVFPLHGAWTREVREAVHEILCHMFPPTPSETRGASRAISRTRGPDLPELKGGHGGSRAEAATGRVGCVGESIVAAKVVGEAAGRNSTTRPIR